MSDCIFCQIATGKIQGLHIIPRIQNDQIDAWPVFEGAKEDITDVYNRVRMA